MVRVCSSIGGDGFELTRSLIALVIDSSLARSALSVYDITQLPCSAYELSLPIDMWDGMLTHVCYSWLASTVAMEEWAEREERE